MNRDACYDPTLLPTLWRALQDRPTAAALHWQGQTIDHWVLLHKILKLAALFAAAGITPGARVAVLLQRSPDMLVVLLALWRLGAVYVPLDTAWPRARTEAALQLCAAQCLVTHESLRSRWERSTCPPLLLEPIDYRAAHPAPAPATSSTRADFTASASDPAYLLFTSGSSGAPKAVQVNHGSLATLFRGVVPLLDLQAEWRMLGCSAFCFDIVFFEWLAPLLASGSLVLADELARQDAAALLYLIETGQVDAMQATPSLWRLLLQHPAAHTLGRLQLAISTGEALDTRTAAQLLDLVPALWNLYGPTECTLWSSAQRVSQEDVRSAQGTIPIGRPIPGYTLHLEPHPEVAADAGELHISGAGVADGYTGAETWQASRFTCRTDGQRSFRSGDLCRRDRQGNLHFLRRCDHQLKINGYRIEAGEIEAHLRSHPGISDAVCLARDTAAGIQLLAFIVCEPGRPNKDRERWNRHLQSWLPHWMLPHRYLVLDTMPLDINGKLDRGRLLQLAHIGTTGATDSNDALQAEVGRLFCSVLAVSDIGPCDSFFDLGGNSMLAATLLLALNQRFDTQLSLRDMLSTPPTVLRLTTLLRQAGVAIEAGAQA